MKIPAEIAQMRAIAGNDLMLCGDRRILNRAQRSKHIDSAFVGPYFIENVLEGQWDVYCSAAKGYVSKFKSAGLNIITRNIPSNARIDGVEYVYSVKRATNAPPPIHIHFLSPKSIERYRYVWETIQPNYYALNLWKRADIFKPMAPDPVLIQMSIAGAFNMLQANPNMIVK